MRRHSAVRGPRHGVKARPPADDGCRSKVQGGARLVLPGGVDLDADSQLVQHRLRRLPRQVRPVAMAAQVQLDQMPYPARLRPRQHRAHQAGPLGVGQVALVAEHAVDERGDRPLAYSIATS